jgi:hypothetical protein
VEFEQEQTNGGYTAQIQSGQILNLPYIGAVILERIKSTRDVALIPKARLHALAARGASTAQVSWAAASTALLGLFACVLIC